MKGATDIVKSKLVLTAIVLIILNSCATSHQLDGYWIGSMKMNGKTVDIIIDINGGNGSFSSKDLMILAEPIDNMESKSGNIGFTVNLDAPMMFEGILQNGNIDGMVHIQGGPPNLKIEYQLSRKARRPAQLYSIENISIKSNGVTLSAQVFTPQTGKLHPALVLLHGSSTNLKNQYAFDADYFANLGFEVLIFDKRGNGQSTGNIETARYSDLVDDAIACLETMKQRKSVDPGKIGLWGYSQGAMLLPRVASRTAIPSFLIAKSPEINGTTEAGAYSDSLRLINSRNSSEDGHIAAESHRQVEKMIRDGNSNKEVEAFIHQNALQHGFMDRTGLYGGIVISKEAFEGLYWKGRVEKFSSYWQNIKIPTLALFGEDDEYVNAKSNEAMIRSFKNSSIETKVFSRANHSLKRAFNPAKDPDIDWPRAIDGYLNFVRNWVAREVGI